ncbi:MAG: rhomboid family intramembrane serine protease [Kineosporiaceae bacterium]
MTGPPPEGVDPAPPAERAPVCPRHADRVSYVRCQRCERPACPDCQVPAAVGVQCVACVREQRRSVPRARTALGAPLGDGRPRLTYGLLAVLVVVFLAQLAGGNRVTAELAFVPALSQAEPWRFLTVALVHSPGFLGHLLLNGLILWTVGREAELMLGTWRYVSVLVLTTLGGSTAILWLTPVQSFLVPTVGISGAVFGLFGAALALEWRQGRPVVRQLVVLLAFALLGIVIPSISWQGHLGGLVAGLAAGAVLVAAPRRNRTWWQVAGLAVVVAVLVALILARWAAVPPGALV